MDNIVTFINDVGSTFKGSVGTLLTINFVVGETAVWLAKQICQALLNLLFALGQAIHVLLVELGVFIEETSESICWAFNLLVTSIDTFFSTLYEGGVGLYMLITRCLHSVYASFCWTLRLIFEASDLVGKTLYLSVSNLFYGISLIPETFVDCLWCLYHNFKSLLSAIGEGGRHIASLIKEAPLQAVLGFVAASVFMYLFYRTAKRIIVERQITPRHVVRWSFQALCFFYVMFINANIMVVRSACRLVEFTLSHLHVPRFHHAGDSDEEDAPGDPDTIPPDGIDDSDPENEDRLETRRRNYNLLIKRREERRQRRSRSKAINNQEDVEDILLEQVEREREDKLCVICQDREKCIMILPCRHLCICDVCQVSLMQRTDRAHSRTCPICRKIVKQTIKAYL